METMPGMETGHLQWKQVSKQYIPHSGFVLWETNFTRGFRYSLPNASMLVFSFAGGTVHTAGRWRE